MNQEDREYEPMDPPDNQGGGGGGAMNAELPGVTQQPARQSDEPPDGDPVPVQTT